MPCGLGIVILYFAYARKDGKKVLDSFISGMCDRSLKDFPFSNPLVSHKALPSFFGFNPA